MSSGGWKQAGSLTDEEVEDHNIAAGLQKTLRRLELDAWEVYPHLVRTIHEELKIWRRLCKKHGMFKEE